MDVLVRELKDELEARSESKTGTGNKACVAAPPAARRDRARSSGRRGLEQNRQTRKQPRD